MTDLAALNTEIVAFLAALGLGGGVSVVTQVIKIVFKIPDGQGGTVFVVVNLVAFVGLALAGTFGVDLDGDAAQQAFEMLALFGEAAASLLAGLGLFGGLRKGNVLGYRAKETMFNPTASGQG